MATIAQSGRATDKKTKDKHRAHIRFVLLNLCDREQAPDQPSDQTVMGTKELNEAPVALLEDEDMHREARFQPENIALAGTSIKLEGLVNETQCMFPTLSVRQGATFGNRFEEHAFIDA